MLGASWIAASAVAAQPSTPILISTWAENYGLQDAIGQPDVKPGSLVRDSDHDGRWELVESADGTGVPCVPRQTTVSAVMSVSGSSVFGGSIAIPVPGASALGFGGSLAAEASVTNPLIERLTVPRSGEWTFDRVCADALQSADSLMVVTAVASAELEYLRCGTVGVSGKGSLRFSANRSSECRVFSNGRLIVGWELTPLDDEHFDLSEAGTRDVSEPAKTGEVAFGWHGASLQDRVVSIGMCEGVGCVSDRPLTEGWEAVDDCDQCAGVCFQTPASGLGCDALEDHVRSQVPTSVKKGDVVASRSPELSNWGDGALYDLCWALNDSNNGTVDLDCWMFATSYRRAMAVPIDQLRVAPPSWQAPPSWSDYAKTGPDGFLFTRQTP